MGFSKQGKKPWLTNVVQLRSKRVFFRLSPSGRNEKNPWDRIPLGRFHTTILSGLFQAGQKAGLTNVVQLRSKRVFSTFPIGAKRKKTLGIEFHEVGFIPGILSGLFQAGQKAGLTNVVQLRSKRVFSTFPIGGNEKTPLGTNSTRSFHTGILSRLFQAGQKAGLTNVVQLRSKRVFSTFAIGGNEKTLRNEFHEVAFIPPF